jgi:hypothetical protein
VNKREIDDLLSRAARELPEVDPAVMERVSASVNSSLEAVRPLPPPWVWSGGLFLICALVAVAGGMVLGPRGIQRMDALETLLVFPVLGLLTWITAAACVAEVTPGSRRRVAAWVLAVAWCVGLAVLFGLLFTDSGTARFVPQGVKCLAAGLLHAIPVSIAAGMWLRRGYAVDSAAAGLSVGLLAGLAGVAMLELHCANFETLHVVVWHIAVLALSAALGMAIGRAIRR